MAENNSIVYCVFYGDYEGQFLNSIWSTEEEAQAQVDRLNFIEQRTDRDNSGYFAEAWVMNIPIQENC